MGKKKRKDGAIDGDLEKLERGCGSHSSSQKGTSWPSVELSQECTLGKGGYMFFENYMQHSGPV